MSFLKTSLLEQRHWHRDEVSTDNDVGLERCCPSHGFVGIQKVERQSTPPGALLAEVWPCDTLTSHLQLWQEGLLLTEGTRGRGHHYGSSGIPIKKGFFFFSRKRIVEMLRFPTTIKFSDSITSFCSHPFYLVLGMISYLSVLIYDLGDFSNCYKSLTFFCFWFKFQFFKVTKFLYHNGERPMPTVLTVPLHLSQYSSSIALAWREGKREREKGCKCSLVPWEKPPATQLLS